jgi:hypothetical protein
MLGAGGTALTVVPANGAGNFLASRRYGTIYIGVTNNLGKQLAEHRAGKGSNLFDSTVDAQCDARVGVDLPA